MDIINNPTVSILNNALDGLAARSQAIMGNIANADTPNYKQVTVNFEDKLRDELAKVPLEGKSGSQNHLGQLEVKITDPRHIPGFEGHGGSNLIRRTINNNFSYRNDNNNVDIEREMTDLAKTGMSYKVISNLEYRAFNKMRTILDKIQ